MNKTLTLLGACALTLSACATYKPTLATPSFQASTITGFQVEAEDSVVVNDGRQFWRLHLRGGCPDVSKQGVGYLVFSDEQGLRAWPDQPWREGYGQVQGWPTDGFYANRSSSFMHVASNRMSWVHPFSPKGAPMTGQYASWGCRVDTVEPLWH